MLSLSSFFHSLSFAGFLFRHSSFPFFSTPVSLSLSFSHLFRFDPRLQFTFCRNCRFVFRFFFFRNVVYFRLNLQLPPASPNLLPNSVFNLSELSFHFPSSRSLLLRLSRISLLFALARACGQTLPLSSYFSLSNSALHNLSTFRTPPSLLLLVSSGVHLLSPYLSCDLTFSLRTSSHALSLFLSFPNRLLYFCILASSHAFPNSSLHPK